jgi:hypothetical protein
VKARLAQLLAKSKAGTLSPEEIAELAGTLNPPVQGSAARRTAGRAPKGTGRGQPMDRARVESPDEYIALLKDFPWFAHVGSLEGNGVTAVRDGREAEGYVCGQLKWLNFKNAIANRVRCLCFDRLPGPQLQRALGQVVKAVKGIIKANRLAAIDRNLSSKYTSPSGSFVYHVGWDLNFAGFEFVCRGAVPPLFFLPVLLPWYARGHYPCGWDGTMIKSDWAGDSASDLPPGRLRVL